MSFSCCLLLCRVPFDLLFDKKRQTGKNVELLNSFDTEMRKIADICNGFAGNCGLLFMALFVPAGGFPI